MFTTEFESDESFVYSVYGVQYRGDTPGDAQQALIDAFDKLILPAAGKVDRVIEDGPYDATKVKTLIWLAYWTTATQYDTWWNEAETQKFWSSLPSDAGMWREVTKISPNRTQYGSNKQLGHGQGAITKTVPLTDKMFYWGCYRDRIKECTPENRLATTLDKAPVRAPAPTDLSQIRSGRTTFTQFPDNLSLVIEGQDHSRISAEERTHWLETFDDAVNTWIDDLVAAGPEKGVLDARICASPPHGLYRDPASPARGPVALDHKYKVELFWFLDHRSMEAIGRSNKGHRGLRDAFIASYCPVGPMAKGDLLLWVETSIAKGEDIQAEYVGCIEGTGFLAYDHDPNFPSVHTN